MRITTLDPITLNDVTDLDNAPFHIDGEGPNALKIYFESEANKAEYLGTPLHGSDLDGESSSNLNAIYAAISDNPITGTIN